MALPSLAPPRSSAAPWQVLAAELDAWAGAGRVARLWWRDDDAVAPSAALDRLLALADGVPLTLAVIPAGAGLDLVRRLDGLESVAIVQHGIAHENHAPTDQKRSELASAAVLPALTEGHRRLAALFGERLLPVLVPPWNRIAPGLIPLLPGCGFAGLSGFGPRWQRLATPGLVQVNTHADPIDWRARRCRPAGEIAVRLAGQLADQRLGRADAGEPVGFLSHHRLDDPAAEALAADLAALVAAHPAARWVGLAEALAP
jgi:hypothetical protein